MGRRLAALAALPFLALASAVYADPAPTDPIGDMLLGVLTNTPSEAPSYQMKASLYHAGARGVGVMDALGCRVVAMRTAATDTRVIPKHTVLFIRETVGLPMPDGSLHDGYWYASDTGGAIKGARIDLFTGMGASSMGAMRKLNMASLTVSSVGVFRGCPPSYAPG